MRALLGELAAAGRTDPVPGGPPAAAATPPPRWHRLLVTLAVATAVAALAFTVLALVDDQRITGADRWLKLWKFAVSISVYAATVAWMVRLVRVHRRTAAVVGGLAGAALAIELVIIAGQAARGTTSHFNEDTPLDGLLFSVMGMAIVFVWLATVVLALVLLRERIAGAGLATGLHWGLGVAAVAMIGGMLMIDPVNEWLLASTGNPPNTAGGAHTVGAPDGGPGLPVVGWSTTAGDLRVGHFIGLHSLQALPLLGFLVDRATHWSDAQRRALVRIAGIGWLGLVLLVLWQAVRAEPLVRPGWVTLGTGALLVLALAAAAVPVLRSRGEPARTDVPADPPVPAG
ncbi:hypothetical protein OF117_17040 [Geodermatophilus sp. YIM 151500]|uniref:hypothetical protein n=1 Tax=Geodermatophilus sp. YIM 151500 TaxID=2984531 RepID=UPI0021E3C808|nr:hypothetical protein [Geodermatophilus sp. YIM 151500]MCV2491062.1 hypothetical protein [Geodermatophilus sp. YIM 151500]